MPDSVGHAACASYGYKASENSRSSSPNAVLVVLLVKHLQFPISPQNAPAQPCRSTPVTTKPDSATSGPAEHVYFCVGGCQGIQNTLPFRSCLMQIHIEAIYSKILNRDPVVCPAVCTPAPPCLWCLRRCALGGQAICCLPQDIEFEGSQRMPK